MTDSGTPPGASRRPRWWPGRRKPSGLSHDDAREIVRGQLEPSWSHGTFCLDDRQIVENDEMYVFDVGAREYLVDGDLSYASPGGVPVVHKADGRLEWLPSSLTAGDRSLRRRKNPHPTLQV